MGWLVPQRAPDLQNRSAKHLPRKRTKNENEMNQNKRTKKTRSALNTTFKLKSEYFKSLNSVTQTSERTEGEEKQMIHRCSRLHHNIPPKTGASALMSSQTCRIGWPSTTTSLRAHTHDVSVASHRRQDNRRTQTFLQE